MADAPYAPVVEALVKQTRAINQLARELKEEFAQYQSAVQSRDTKRASAIADAINQRTARLVAATDKLEASTPDAGIDNSPGGSGRPDNALPGRPGPGDPGYDKPDILPGGPDAGLPIPPARPDAGLPEKPVDPGFGGGRPQPGDPGYGQGAGNRPDAGLPSAPARPDAGLPPAPARPDAGLPPAPARPGQGLPPAPARPDAGLPPAEGGVDNTLPGEGAGTKPVDPDAPTAGNELPEGGDSAGGETKPVEPAEPTAEPK